jgi:predicted transcriptional regulator
VSDNLTNSDLLKMSVDLTSAYLSNHTKTLEEIPSVLSAMHKAIDGAYHNPHSLLNRPTHQPAVPISESVTDEYIVCLEDGKKLQMLKRHLNTVYKMSLDQYKERWGLPQDYPSTAPSYSKRRTQIAKNTGLGLTRRPRKKYEDRDVL